MENEAITWLKAQQQGVSHDGQNHVYTVTPPSGLLTGIGRLIQLDYDEELAVTKPKMAVMQMVSQSAAFMISDSNDILFGDSWKFKLMFATPHHRLWCANYPEGIEQFQKDCISVFGTYESLTPDTASKMIKNLFAV
jgi:hypothetical protein